MLKAAAGFAAGVLLGGLYFRAHSQSLRYIVVVRVCACVRVSVRVRVVRACVRDKVFDLSTSFYLYVLGFVGQSGSKPTKTSLWLLPPRSGRSLWLARTQVRFCCQSVVVQSEKHCHCMRAHCTVPALQPLLQ